MASPLEFVIGGPFGSSTFVLRYGPSSMPISSAFNTARQDPELSEAVDVADQGLVARLAEGNPELRKAPIVSEVTAEVAIPEHADLIAAVAI